MSDDRGPYSRIYHRFAKEYKAIWNDDRALAAWVRLLVVADASWPLPPPLPRSVRSSALRTLIQAGVVIPDDDTYTVLGLDAERNRRRDAARVGAAKRWHSDGNATAMPRRDETRKDETSTARAGARSGAPRGGPMTRMDDAIASLVAVGESRIP